MRALSRSSWRVELGDALAMVLERRICAIAGFGLATLLFFSFSGRSHAEP